ncbi:transmembrane protein, putative (macronuclear) [Tetrahymena thermophila SB210]|uniref:Transmembrane protein, putative n=1 Tax=Tetrahymena thermophila (strain SB210) TaxID=312017 RepID=W7XKL8_TETTS|nr:transmembrane protein, putative [Tetrahymena thermophila SB210]EWS76641.1 transmembrane protein, putative [Tetrahymena thermophila SB210]|eukprot:XP_012650809.1 transmembrane protein, putative [Tetrahymena thermophila SB210]
MVIVSVTKYAKIALAIKTLSALDVNTHFILIRIAIIVSKIVLVEHTKTLTWNAFLVLLNFAQAAHLLNAINAYLDTL